MKKIALIGMGGLGKEVLGYIKIHSPEVEVCGYYDDDRKEAPVPYLGNLDDIGRDDDCSYIISLSSTSLKRKIAGELSGKGLSFGRLNYGQSYSENTPGQGTIICPGVVLTVDVVIAEHCLVNLNATIGHDVGVGSYSSIMPGVNISGNVVIGEGVLIGTGAQILQGVRIGDNAIVGAGAVVTKDVEKGATVVGVPARRVWKSF